MYNPPLRNYCRLSKEYNLIPVYREYLMDTETPVSLYGKLSPTGPSFLLESVEGGTHLARYSFIGLNSLLNYQFHQGCASYRGTVGSAKLHGGPLEALKGLLSRFRSPQMPGLPRFTSGMVGYFSYDLVRYLEKLPDLQKESLCLPLCQMMLPGVVLIFDHVKRTLLIVANLPRQGAPEDTYQQAIATIDQMAERIFQAPQQYAQNPLPEVLPWEEEKLYRELANSSTTTREQFEGSVKQALEYIRRGDIFQVVLSQRFSLPFSGSAFELYRRLRAINPSPYLYYFNFGDTYLVGASPEMLVRLAGNQLYSHPIAGTRPRGANEQADQQLAQELLEDEKERAEHLMLVDLGRNDLGRVCQPGTVEVSRYMEVERYSHVMHLVSEVRGQLEPDGQQLEALAACFPAGTVSGAPKIRAMEIIEELEPIQRGIYAGAVGYLDFAGNMDTAITIRTAVIHQGKAYFQAGAGIVADSDPTKEYLETLHKARAMAVAVLACQRGGELKNAGGNR